MSRNFILCTELSSLHATGKLKIAESGVMIRNSPFHVQICGCVLAIKLAIDTYNMRG